MKFLLNFMWNYFIWVIFRNTRILRRDIRIALLRYPRTLVRMQAIQKPVMYSIIRVGNHFILGGNKPCTCMLFNEVRFPTITTWLAGHWLVAVAQSRKRPVPFTTRKTPFVIMKNDCQAVPFESISKIMRPCCTCLKPRLYLAGIF